MAISTDNVVMKGMKGMVGKMLVFRQRFGKTIATKIPVKTAAATDKQVQVQAKFRLAAIYAKAATKDPATMQAYKNAAQPGQSAFNMALSDYFIAPEITEITTDAYNGTIGSKIRVTATDDFMVKSVDVKIAKADGTLIEEGAAVQDATNELYWWYTATQANASISGCKITATAKDLPANVTVKDQVIS
jgi:hypothetical protein